MLFSTIAGHGAIDRCSEVAASPSMWIFIASRMKFVKLFNGED